MDRILYNMVLCGGIALASLMGSSGAANTLASGTANALVSSARRETQILSAFSADPLLRAYDLTVSVDGEHAVLGGAVDSNAAKARAAQSAAAADGIRHVDNRIRVDASAVAPIRERVARSAETITGDATISDSVRSRLLWNTHTEGLDIRIETRDGKVTLTGSAISYAERDVAGIVAANTNGVVGVSNELALTEQPRPVAKPGDGNESLTQKDSWITSRVKSSLALTRGISGAAIAVTTRRGVVSLSGAVPTKADRESAMQVAQDTRGVKDVVADGLTAG